MADSAREEYGYIRLGWEEKIQRVSGIIDLRPQLRKERLHERMRWKQRMKL